MSARSGPVPLTPLSSITVITEGGAIFGMEKATGNLKFSPAYRAPPKNIVELEKRTGRGVFWRKATEYFVAVCSYSKPVSRCTVRGMLLTLEVKLSSRSPPQVPEIWRMGRGPNSDQLNHH